MFDLNSYETVKERKKRFYADHPNGSIVVRLKNPESITECAWMEAEIFLTKEDQEKGLVAATGNAFEMRDTEKSISQYGKEYESVNYSSWVENCEESAIGRALDNAGYSGNAKCSREEMQKVQRWNETKKTKVEKPKVEKPKVETPKVETYRTNEQQKNFIEQIEKQLNHATMNMLKDINKLLIEKHNNKELTDEEYEELKRKGTIRFEELKGVKVK